MRPLVKIVAEVIRRNPKAIDDMEYLLALVGEVIPRFNDKTKCLNCGGSMLMTATTLNLHTAILLIGMAKEVKKRHSYMLFTEANKIHVSSSEHISHAAQCHTTQAAKLGLIAKSNPQPYWAITKLGWRALRGESVPKKRIMFKGKIVERPEETTTLTKVFDDYRQRVQRLKQQQKNVREDDTEQMRQYNPRDYADPVGYREGVVI